MAKLLFVYTKETTTSQKFALIFMLSEHSKQQKHRYNWINRKKSGFCREKKLLDDKGNGFKVIFDRKVDYFLIRTVEIEQVHGICTTAIPAMK
jgi:hypothetical protein